MNLHAQLNYTYTVSQLKHVYIRYVTACRVWDEYAEGRDCGDDVAMWLQKCLETPNIRLAESMTCTRFVSSAVFLWQTNCVHVGYDPCVYLASFK